MKLFWFIILLLSVLFVSCSKNVNETVEKPVIRKFASFIFVGNIKGNPGLYKYNAANNSFSEFWSSPDEEVVELSCSNNLSSAFFLTATKIGKEGIFPSIKDTRLYVIPNISSNPEFVQDIGSGMQVFSRWESDIVFRIVVNRWDKKISSLINQTTLIFTTYGRVLQEENKFYDIIKDGYPRLPESRPSSLSPSGKYQLSYNSERRDSIFLVKISDKSRVFLTVPDKPINEIRWSDDRKFIFISTLDVSQANTTIFNEIPNTSSIYIYSIDQGKVTKKITGGGFKNFFTINDFLIFDDGFRRNSSIYVYNFRELKIKKQIRLRDGCGLHDIPEIPKSGT